MAGERFRVILAALLLLAAGGMTSSRGDTTEEMMSASIRVLWDGKRAVSGTIQVSRGQQEALDAESGQGGVSETGFQFREGDPPRLRLTLRGVHTGIGPGATKITVAEDAHPFSFWLRDVSARWPIHIPEYGVMVTDGDDGRDYDTIAEDLRGRGLSTRLEQIRGAAEETFESAAAATKALTGPTWLGLSRDIRLFEIDFVHNRMTYAVRPRLHARRIRVDERDLEFEFQVGRGSMGVVDLTRRLEEGVLPILDARKRDGAVVYDVKCFVVPEISALTAASLRGTHYLVADDHAAGRVFTEGQEKEAAALRDKELNRPEETVLFARVTATNTGEVPRHAFLLNARPNVPFTHDTETGFAVLADGSVAVVSRLDGGPMPQQELAALLGPGDSVTFEFRIPHRPIPRDRAAALAAQDFEGRLSECRAFWRGKLAAAARFDIPEARMDEMVQAGLLHLDLITYGLEPAEPLAATIGIYAPIGSESAPIIQFYDSMGWHEVARRSIQYFLEKQHEDGFMQNFGGYMLENGAALWTMGEHYRYTRDDDWVASVKPHILRSCDYLRQWRERNLREELRGRGYGLMEGKVGDPEDPYRQYGLNGYAYLGLIRAAEMLRRVDAAESERIAQLAEELRVDVLQACRDSLARCPVVPLGDGRWAPTVAQWAEAESPSWMLTDNPTDFTHGSFTVRETLLGPLYLVFHELIAPDSTEGRWMTEILCDLFTERNVGPCQPYYSQHPWIHLRNRDPKPFIQFWYNCVAGLADRETYSFWEHYFHASPHKTHEEAWFLMQTRWMLYLEDGETLRLLAGAPRQWLEPGKRIAVTDAASYFGPVRFRVEARGDGKRLTAMVAVAGSRGPATVEIRLPHPEGRRAVRVEGGDFDPATETVTVRPFRGEATVTADF